MTVFGIFLCHKHFFILLFLNSSVTPLLRPSSAFFVVQSNIHRLMLCSRWEASLAAAKASVLSAPTRPRTPPMEKRRLAQEAKRKAREKAEKVSVKQVN